MKSGYDSGSKQYGESEVSHWIALNPDQRVYLLVEGSV